MKRRTLHIKVILKTGAPPVVERTLNTPLSIQKMAKDLRRKYPKACEIHVRGVG